MAVCVHWCLIPLAVLNLYLIFIFGSKGRAFCIHKPVSATLLMGLMAPGVITELGVSGLVTRVIVGLCPSVLNNGWQKNKGALWVPVPSILDMVWCFGGKGRIFFANACCFPASSAKSCSLLFSATTQLLEYHSIQGHVQTLMPRRILHISLALYLKSASFHMWLGQEFILFRSSCLAHNFTSYYYDTISSVPWYILVEMSSTVA